MKIRAATAISAFIFASVSFILASFAPASSFLPTPVDLVRLRSLDQGTSSTDARRIRQLLSLAPRNQDYIQIDDMRFLKAGLKQQSGFSGSKWTGGRIYYAFDSSVDATNQQRWLDAAAEWSAVAAVTFSPRTTQANYIYVKGDVGNWSYVGMIGGRQEMGLYNWTYRFIIAHEIGHALGLSHEHTRSDRDSYVTILTANVDPTKMNNFEKDTTTNYGAYDFDSVMHYPKDAFSTNDNNTIEPLPAYSQWLNLIGQRTHLSNADKTGMGQRYGAAATPSPTPNPTPGATPKPGEYWPMYNIVYKRGGQKVDRAEIETAGGLRITGGGANDTLSIRKAKGYSSFPAIPSIITNGGFKMLYTEADVGSLSVTGDLKGLTTRKSYATNVQAGALGAVTMIAAPNSTENRIFLITALVSQGTGSDLKAVVRLSGVSLDRLEAPSQKASIRVGSKKYAVRGGVPYGSYGGLLPRSGGSDADLVKSLIGGPYGVEGWSDADRRLAAGARVRLPQETTPAGDSGISQVNVASASSIIVSGGGIFSERLLAGNCPKISAQSLKFTYVSGTTIYLKVLFGNIECKQISATGPKLSVSALGGNLTPSEISAGGAIGTIEARQRAHRFPSGTLVLWGGTFVCPAILAGAASGGPEPNIALIHGDNGVNMWLDSSDSKVYYYLGTMKAGTTVDGKIRMIRTKSTTAKDLQTWVKNVGGPFICGKAYSNKEPVTKFGKTDYYSWSSTP
ncbi:MAG: M12 family metallopeptidase [Candidatus Sumerlaeota bacterium]|nr:M12 family metallopeptidase [Candidatus Sumerlaeota bacterium]